MVVRTTSLIARVCMRMPRWIIPFIESARVQQDYTSWIRIHFRKP